MQIVRSGRRRRIALALLVAGLPCLLLVVFASRVIEQEHELETTRAHERRAALLQSADDRLRARLERVRLEVAAGVDPSPPPVIVAERSGDSFTLPWSVAGTFDEWPRERRVRELIARGEQAELVRRDFDAAASHFRGAAASDDPASAAYAQLLVARVLAKTGSVDDASAIYARIARASPDMRDDQQIPLALYALERLGAFGGSAERSLVTRLAEQSGDFSPPALHLLREVAVRQQLDDVVTAVDRRLVEVAQAERLMRDFRALQASAGESLHEGGWAAYGDDLWLVGTVDVASGGKVVAVRGSDLVDSIVADDPQFSGMELSRSAIVSDDDVVPSVAGLAMRLPLDGSEGSARQGRLGFVLAALALVLVTSLAAAGLLLRDVQREGELAALRAQFVASVSHELKTPLSAIRMYAESLRMGRRTSMERRDAYLETILNESERLSRLLDNILEFSKIERGERRYQLAEADLGSVVERSLRAAAYPLKQSGFELALHVEEGLPPVRVDEDAVEQALLNLLTNAMKYSGESRCLQVRVEQERQFVALRVIDRGVGIAADERDKIFQKFYRASNSSGVSGAGLGLSIVEHIVRNHGGAIALRTAPGEGSEFTLRFPVEVT